MHFWQQFHGCRIETYIDFSTRCLKPRGKRREDSLSLFDISVALTSCTVAIESKYMYIGLPVKSHKSQYDGTNEDVFARYAEQI